jgi:hypothetical protein
VRHPPLPPTALANAAPAAAAAAAAAAPAAAAAAPAPTLQTAKGGQEVNARGPTRAEFRAFVKAVKRKWKQLDKREAIWSWDNARIHGRVAEGEWEEMGITPEEFTNLPPYSPDLHNVIERSHARVMMDMQNFINMRVTTTTYANDSLPPYIAELQAVFTRTITPQWAQAATYHLFLRTLPSIIQNRGDYADRRFR